MTRADLHHAIGWAAWYRRRQRDLDRRRCLLRAIEIRRYLRDTSPPRESGAATSSPPVAAAVGAEPNRPPLPPVAPGASALVARLLEPQPPPVGDGDSVADAAVARVSSPIVRELLLARREQGRARYGTELRAWNGRYSTADLVQELTDALLYATQRDTEGREPYPGALAEVIEQALHRIATDAAKGYDRLPHELPSMPVEDAVVFDEEVERTAAAVAEGLLGPGEREP